MTTIFPHIVLLAVLAPSNGFASAFQSLEAIDARAADVAGGPVRPVDRRLKLAACPSTLQADPLSMGAVIVRCVPLGWRIRVLMDGASASTSTSTIIIKRGDPVTVNFVAPGFSVTTSGTAESEARAGERVRVRVEQKATPVMGEAINASSVRVVAVN